MVKSYARGRRFEYHVVDKLAKNGISSRRIVLSGRQPAFGQQPISDVPNCDIIVEERFKGKAKTTKAKRGTSAVKSAKSPAPKGARGGARTRTATRASPSWAAVLL